MMILESVEERFYDSASDIQRKAFGKFCKEKFPNARGLPITVGEIQTQVYLIIEFAYAEQVL